jgi:hypothetical protein
MLREARRPPRLLRRLLVDGRSRALDPAAWQAELLFGQALPAAPLSRRLDRPQDARGIWMRADPVSLTPDLGAVWIDRRARLDPASPVVEELAAMFADEGMALDLPVAGRGYLQLRELPECHFAPPWLLAGESMDRVWPSGPDARRWRHLLNETQMILHQHRHASAELPQSLWFWGAGQLPDRPASPRVTAVEADSLEWRAAAGWAGMAPSAVTLEQGIHAGTLLEWPADHGDSADDNLERLALWLKSAWRRLRLRPGFHALEIASNQRVWRFTKHDAWRIW